MKKIFLTLLLVLCCGALVAQSEPEASAKQAIVRFEDALQRRDLNAIDMLMARDLVAIENGHRNEGWQDFRDHHLVPEMKEPAPEIKSRIVRISAKDAMAWGYSEAELTIRGHAAKKTTALLYSIYILEKRDKTWKIVLLDWSIRSVSSE